MAASLMSSQGPTTVGHPGLTANGTRAMMTMTLWICRVELNARVIRIWKANENPKEPTAAMKSHLEQQFTGKAMTPSLETCSQIVTVIIAMCTPIREL
jgi:hypothetical protein